MKDKQMLDYANAHPEDINVSSVDGWAYWCPVRRRYIRARSVREAIRLAAAERRSHGRP